LLVAAGNVYFRDLEHIVGIALMAWFFLTPVLYPLEAIPPGARGYFLLNPMTPVVDAYRAVFFYGAWPDWGQLWRTGLGGLAALLVALAGFVRWQRAVAEEI
ncbi:MAG: ABC transporter permease, partial [Firmicutes bacterium]|nr:ABC transporter permease [Bacillota bacterium]